MDEFRSEFWGSCRAASLKQSLSKGFYAIRYFIFLAGDDGLREAAFAWPELPDPSFVLNGSAALDGL